MAGFIIIADLDAAYAQALADRIRSHCPALRVATATDEETLLDLMRHQSEPPILIISEAHFRMDRLPDSARLIISLQTGRNPHASDIVDTPTRLGSIRPILRRLDLAGCSQSPAKSEIRAGLSEVIDTGHSNDVTLKSAKSVEKYDAEETTDSRLESLPEHRPDQTLPRVILLMTQTTAGRDTQYADDRCRALSEGGTLIHYLPLMPNYYCSQWRLLDTGSTFGLTDLLLRIGIGGLSISELGAFESMDMLGRLQFRPTDRSDDIAHARAEDLYRLCSLLRERTLLESRTLLVVETAGLAFRQIRPILALCDRVEVIFPSSDRYVDEMLRREIGDVLADLPSLCRVVRVPDRQNSGRPGAAMQTEVG